jgi:hypothetical protein
MAVKSDFLEEAKKIERKGMDGLLSYLQNSDFFQAPASTIFHGSQEGGLALHSLAVTDLMKELNEMTEAEQPEDSILVCGLFHDVCKIDFYKVDDREASKAQINFMLDLCEQNHVNVPTKAERTVAYVSKVIDALLAKKPIPAFKQSYRIEDQLPMGHGEKSVFILNQFIRLTDGEALAIRWHLAGFDPGVNFAYPSGLPQKQAFRDYKLVPLLATADMAASYLLDEW